jgi:uncharacterized protein (UPF0179 family)
MSHRARSTPLSALFKTGSFRQYELCIPACQMSPTRSTALPSSSGRRYRVTAGRTSSARCVKVPQP